MNLQKKKERFFEFVNSLKNGLEEIMLLAKFFLWTLEGKWRGVL